MQTAPSVRSPEIKPAARRGATVVEVLTVAVVTAVAAGVVLSDSGAWAAPRAAAAGRLLGDDLRYARGRAVVTGRAHTVTVDAGAGVYRILDAGGAPVPDPLRPGRAGGFERNFAAETGGWAALRVPLRVAGGSPAATTGITFTPAGGTDDPAADVVFWCVSSRFGGERAGQAGSGSAGDWQVVRARVVGATGQVWVDGPHPHDATLTDRLAAGEADLHTGPVGP